MGYRSALLNQSSDGVLGRRGRWWIAVVLQVGKPAGRDWDGSEVVDGSLFRFIKPKVVRGAGGGWGSTNWKFVATGRIGEY
jgi:hypothetical protein